MDTESNESLLISKNLDPEKDNVEQPTPESLSKRLDDIVKSVQIINQRLKDLSMERKYQVSQMQWATIEEFKTSSKASVQQNRFWQKSLFARTYFADKDLDELYKHVMKYSSMLFTYLNNLNGKIQCKTDTELDSISTPRIPKSEMPLESPRGSVVTLSVDHLPPKKTTETACGDDEELDNAPDFRTIQQCFTDLIRAKVEFDSQFLKFNAMLSKTSYSDDFQCLYEICAKSNMILEQTSLSIDKCESLTGDNVRLKRKRQSINNDDEGQSSHTKNQPRRSKRLAEIADEVQIIRSLKRIK